MSDEAPKVSAHNAVPSCTFSTIELQLVSGCETWVFGEMLTSCLMYCAMSCFIISRKKAQRLHEFLTFSMLNLAMASCAVET